MRISNDSKIRQNYHCGLYRRHKTTKEPGILTQCPAALNLTPLFQAVEQHELQITQWILQLDGTGGLFRDFWHILIIFEDSYL